MPQPVVLTQVLRGLGRHWQNPTRPGICLPLWRDVSARLVGAGGGTRDARLRLCRPGGSPQLPQQAAQDQPETIAAVRQWLEHHEGWLLILDNAPEPSAIHAYLPRTTHGHIIITSRHFGWGRTARSLTVPVLPREEAVKLLLEVTQQSDGETAGAIAETLGDLPLAVAQAAAYIEATGLSLSAYLQRLQTHLEALLSRGEGSPDYPDTVATTWEWRLSPPGGPACRASSLLKLCAFFAPDDIPMACCASIRQLLPEPLVMSWSPMTSNGTMPSWPCGTMP